MGSLSLTNPFESLLLPVLGSVVSGTVADWESVTAGSGWPLLSAIRLDLRGDVLPYCQFRTQEVALFTSY